MDTKAEYRIREVSEKLELPASTIRYWEGEFGDLIQTKKTPGKQRRYSQRNIEQLRQIRELLHIRKKTISEARALLKSGNEDTGTINWAKQSILLTGGTGSFGRHFCKVMMEKYHPKVIRIYSRGELKQHEMRQEFGEEKIRYFIGDVRDGERLRRAMEGADIVVHAAALKQVPACEYNPLEAVKTNILGAENVIDAAINTGVKKVVALSTDKAANPANLYGATKLCAEKIFVQGNSYSGPRGTRFSCVRYGNVIGSRGSVIPVFREQKKTGRITLTDEKMTRFWITLDQAVDLVVAALCHMQGGEIFIPRIPSMKITDLAKAIAPECKIETIGIRPGEKLHEILITTEEGRNTVAYNGMYVIMPEHAWWGGQGYKTSREVPEGFVYASNSNDQWLDIDALRKITGDSSSAGDDAIAHFASTVHRLSENIILDMIGAEERIPNPGKASEART
ncbi:MAG: UDP-N-acetylglucosamine 4,6-dehydratase (inverting) [Deltaproteobacteria bacterium]|nr:UDP-N-acetylglucosamine 4,6-dehydratase (inverting) [Deltaproteobacteria bacterium]